MALNNVAERAAYANHLNHHPDDVEHLRFLKAAALKASGVSRLYKYCRPETARLIMKQGLQLQAPDSYNDPFDCLSGVNVWSSSHRFAPDDVTVEAALSEVRALPIKFQLPTYDLHHDMRMSYTAATTCFSEQPDEHLLWSHYADNHKGVCLAFEVAPLLAELHPCTYQAEMPEASAWRSDNLALALIKGTPWSYEKEWRIVRKTTRPKMRILGSITHQIYSRIHADPRFAVSDHEEWSNITSGMFARLEQAYNAERIVDVSPSEVILGLNAHRQFTNVTTGECCDEIREIAAHQNIAVSRVQVVPNSFELAFVDVTNRDGWTQPVS